MTDKRELIGYGLNFLGFFLIFGITLFVYFNYVLLCKYDNEPIVSSVIVQGFVEERGNAKLMLICDNFLTEERVSEIVLSNENKLIGWKREMLYNDSFKYEMVMDNEE